MHEDLVSSFYIPEDKDPESFGAIMYAVFYNNAPYDTGRMRDGIEYEVDDEFVWFYNSVVYANYQNTRTSLAGWWDDGLDHAYNIAYRDALSREDV